MRLFWRVITCSVIIFSMISCEKKLTYERAIKRSYGKIVDFSWNKQYVKQDTAFFESESLKTPIKIVSYIDKMLCDSCFKKYLFGANLLVSKYPEDSVKYICIVASRTEERLKKCMDGLNSESCVVIQDMDDSFISLNSFERHSAFCRTFLLDANNKILLTGDPLRHSGLQKLYVEKINELIKRGGTSDGEMPSEIRPIKLTKTDFDIGDIHVGDTVSFDISLRNLNKRAVSITFVPECDELSMMPQKLIVDPKMLSVESCYVVVNEGGEFIKRIMVQTNNTLSQIITIKGTAEGGI